MSIHNHTQSTTTPNQHNQTEEKKGRIGRCDARDVPAFPSQREVLTGGGIRVLFVRLPCTKACLDNPVPEHRRLLW